MYIRWITFISLSIKNFATMWITVIFGKPQVKQGWFGFFLYFILSLKVASIAVKIYNLSELIIFFSAIIATFICLEPNENILLFDWIVIYLILIQVSVPVSDSQDVSLASLKFCSSEETTNFSHDNVTSCQFKCSCDITHVCSEVVIFIATDKQWKLCEISALPWTKSLIKCMKGFW